MYRNTLSPTSTVTDLQPVVMTVHEILNRLPVTARARDVPGMRFEEGRTPAHFRVNRPHRIGEG
ncbi:MAG: DUF2111 domain-containing protein [Methanomicrobiales archaeon]|jgi:hypothetical protein|nr:DUF2111 domain-containing protein [Methanomicrobiales archaeon]